MIRLFLCFTSIALAFAQDEIPAPAKSPYDIDRYVKTHKDVQWAPLLSGFGIDPRELPRACEAQDPSTCTSELIEIQNARQVIVRVAEDNWQETYLRFFPVGADWRYAGSVTPIIKDYDPKHQVTSFGGTPFLLVNNTGASGSGITSEFQQWFDLTRPSFEPVFGYTIQENAFKFEDHVISAGSRHTLSVYTRQANGEFKFDATLSTSSQKETEDLYESLFDLSHEDFLRYQFNDLRKIADAKDSVAREWLAFFLSNCKNTPEKRKLAQSLAAHR
jgi:hypothetical protein